MLKLKIKSYQPAIHALKRRPVNPLVDQVKKILGSSDQRLILMARG